MGDALARCGRCEVTGEPLVARETGLVCEDNDGCAARVNALYRDLPSQAPRPAAVPLSLLPDELLRRAARVRDNRGARVAYQDAAWLVRKALAAPKGEGGKPGCVRETVESALLNVAPVAPAGGDALAEAGDAAMAEIMIANLKHDLAQWQREAAVWREKHDARRQERDAAQQREAEIGEIVAGVGYRPRINCTVVEAVRLMGTELAALRAQTTSTSKESPRG